MSSRFVPNFDNPYPDQRWSRIGDFDYIDDLVLLRMADAPRKRNGKADADYIVAQDYTVAYKLDGAERRLTVPRGLITDLASVPRAARSIVGRVGPHLEASIVHDFLYVAWQDVPDRGAREADRRFADDLLRAGLIAANVGAFKRWAMYQAVRDFGAGVYRSPNAERYVALPAPPAPAQPSAPPSAPGPGSHAAVA